MQRTAQIVVTLRSSSLKMRTAVAFAAALAGASAFAPGAVLPTSSRNVAAVGPTMQRIGSARPAGGSMGGNQGSAGGQGSGTCSVLRPASLR